MNIRTLLRRFIGVFVDFSESAGQAHRGAPRPEEQVNRVTLSFWLVLLAGLVFLFGFDAHQMEDLMKRFLNADHMTPFESWEVGALVWNALFAVYFYLKVPPTDKLIVEKVTPVVIFFGVIGLTVLAARTLLWNAWHYGFRHVLYVLLIGILFLFVDGLHARVQKNPRHKREFKQCLLLADLPMVPALAVLVFYQAYFPHIPSELKERDLEFFLSGAISFQLLASTLIFACIQAGVFHRAFGWFRNPEHNLAQESALQTRGAAV